MCEKRSENEKFILEIVQDTDSECPREWGNVGTMICWHRNHNTGDKHNYSDVRQFLEQLTMDLKLHDALITKYKPQFKIEQHQDYFIVKHGDTVVLDNPNNKYTESQSNAEDWIDDHIQTDFFENEIPDHELLELIQTKAIILPIYCYSHSGTAYSTAPFSCKWDSGQIGYIYATHEKINKEWKDTPLEKAQSYLEGEVETYNQWANGEVYGFRILEKKKCECCQHVETDEIDSCYGFYGDDIKENGMQDQIGEQYQDLINTLDYYSEST